MRLLDPILQSAMDSGNFTPIVRAAILDPDDHSVVEYLDLVYYRINGIDIDIEFYDPSGSFSDSVSLERVAKIGDTEYTIFSGIYRLTRSYRVKGGKSGLYICSGSLVEPTAVEVPGDVSYHAVIDSVMDYGTNVAAFKDPAASWLNYQFLSDGQSFLTADIYSFFALLRQKYLIHAAENGIDSILFFSVADTLALPSQYTISLSGQDTWSIHADYRQFIWKDEAGTFHNPGPELMPIHNLGYLESTASPPSIPDHVMQIADTLVTCIPNLKYQTGDCVEFDPGIGGYSLCKSVLDVTEVFNARDHRTKETAWYMELRPLAYFSTTPGGYIPPTAQYTTAYSQLVTSGFCGVLDHSIVNVQALADAVDQYSSLQYRVTTPTIRIPGKDFAWSTDDTRLYAWAGGAWQAIATGKIIGPSDNVLSFNISSDITVTFPNSMTFPADAAGVLMNDGMGVLSWEVAAGGGLPAGDDTYVQYNDGGAFGGDQNFTWDKTLTKLILKGHEGSETNHNATISGFADGETSQGLLITGGDNLSEGVGGNLNIKGGDSYAGSQGGGFWMTAGSGVPGGDITASGGAAWVGSNGNGGSISFNAGGADGSGHGGSVYFSTGQGATTGVFCFTQGSAAPAYLNFANLTTSIKTFTFPNADGTIALLEIANIFAANQTIASTSAAAGIQTIATMTNLGSGAIADGGVMNMRGKTSTTTGQLMGALKWQWNVATHSSAVADVTFEAGYNSGSSIVGKEFLRGRGGSSPLVGVACTLATGGVTYRTLSVHGSQLWLGQDSSSESPIFEIVPAYTSATHSTYKTRTLFSVYDGDGSYELIRLEAQGSNPKMSFFGVAAVAQPSAYTQTYSTASKTVPNNTASNPPVGGTGTAAGGYDTAAHRDSMITSLTNCIADVTALKKVVNAIIDDLQSLGLAL